MICDLLFIVRQNSGSVQEFLCTPDGHFLRHHNTCRDHCGGRCRVVLQPQQSKGAGGGGRCCGAMATPRGAFIARVGRWSGGGGWPAQRGPRAAINGARPVSRVAKWRERRGRGTWRARCALAWLGVPGSGGLSSGVRTARRAARRAHVGGSAAARRAAMRVDAHRDEHAGGAGVMVSGIGTAGERRGHAVCAREHARVGAASVTAA